jgi:hypothetical protein
LFIRPGTAIASPLRMAATPNTATDAAVGSVRPRTSREPSIAAPAWKPDAVGPGHIAVTVTPLPRVSSASASLNDSTYAFVA